MSPHYVIVICLLLRGCQFGTSTSNGCWPYNKRSLRERAEHQLYLSSNLKAHIIRRPQGPCHPLEPPSTFKFQMPHPRMQKTRKNPWDDIFQKTKTMKQNLPCPSIVFLRIKVAPSPVPDLWMQIPRNWLVFPLAYGSAVVTRRMLPIDSKVKWTFAIRCRN